MARSFVNDPSRGYRKCDTVYIMVGRTMEIHNKGLFGYRTLRNIHCIRVHNYWHLSVVYQMKRWTITSQLPNSEASLEFIIGMLFRGSGIQLGWNYGSSATAIATINSNMIILQLILIAFRFQYACIHATFITLLFMKITMFKHTANLIYMGHTDRSFVWLTDLEILCTPHTSRGH